MKTRTVLSWLLLAGMLASGMAQATIPDRASRSPYDDALQMSWLQEKSHAKAIVHDGDIRGFNAGSAVTPLTAEQLAPSLYALGGAVYLAFIFLLGLLVGFNNLDTDK